VVPPEPVAEATGEEDWQGAHDERHAEVGAGGLGVADHAGRAGARCGGKKRYPSYGGDKSHDDFQAAHQLLTDTLASK